MTQTVDDLVRRAKDAGLTMAKVCKATGVAKSTVSRARKTDGMKMQTFRRLSEFIAESETNTVAEDA